MDRSVLFVSKPIAPPFHDGTKCLVRDVALNLRRHRAVLMGAGAGTDLGDAPAPGSPGVSVAPVYGSSGRFSPTLSANARAALFLMARSRADIWHFVFAPNPRTSAVGRVARALRRVPVVQTVASPPRRFEPSLFFGDIVVAQSRWTLECIAAAFRASGRLPPRLELVPPPVGPLREPGRESIQRARAALDLPDGAPVLLYPGDLEVSRGAETVERAIPGIVQALPDAVVVFACRAKTAEAPRLAAALRRRLPARNARVVGEVDLLALLSTASVVLLPIDDLYGKVDLPISALEAMRLGVPVVALDQGPLADLTSAVRVAPGDAEAVARAAVALCLDPAHRSSVVEAGRQAIRSRHDASVVAAAYERLYEELLGTAR